jgi:hypothetical protein
MEDPSLRGGERLEEHLALSGEHALRGLARARAQVLGARRPSTARVHPAAHPPPREAQDRAREQVFQLFEELWIERRRGRSLELDLEHLFVARDARPKIECREPEESAECRRGSELRLLVRWIPSELLARGRLRRWLRRSRGLRLAPPGARSRAAAPFAAASGGAPSPRRRSAAGSTSITTARGIFTKPWRFS